MTSYKLLTPILSYLAILCSIVLQLYVLFSENLYSIGNYMNYGPIKVCFFNQSQQYICNYTIYELEKNGKETVLFSWFHLAVALMLCLIGLCVVLLNIQVIGCFFTKSTCIRVLLAVSLFISCATLGVLIFIYSTKYVDYDFMKHLESMLVDELGIEATISASQFKYGLAYYCLYVALFFATIATILQFLFMNNSHETKIIALNDLSVVTSDSTNSEFFL